MTDRDLMQQALEALFAMLTHMGLDEDEWNKATFDQCRKAEADLRERLAQPEPAQQRIDYRAECWPESPHYKPAQQQSAERVEPVAITEQMALAFHNALTDGPIGSDDMMDIMRGLKAAFVHIAAPQPANANAGQRSVKPWVGLTDEEIEDAWPFVWRKHESVRHFAIYHAIEAKLREKNA